MDEKACEVDPDEILQKIILKTHSGGVQNGDGCCKAEYRQQSVNGTPVSVLSELYYGAKRAKPCLEQFLVQIPSRYGGGFVIRVVDLKDPVRASVKAEKEYSATIRQSGPGISWVSGVARASIICSSLQQIVDVVEWLQESAYIISA
jgi:hypothetical protein